MITILRYLVALIIALCGFTAAIWSVFWGAIKFVDDCMDNLGEAMSNDTSEIDADIQWYVDQCKMNNIAVDNYQLGRFVERVCINLNDDISLDQARSNAFSSIFT